MAVGTHSPWASRLLASQCAEIYVANARKLRFIFGSDCKSDVLDAEMLVRTLLVQCAHYVLGRKGPDTDLKRYGERIASQGGKIAKRKAVIAVARELAVLLHALWKTGEVYAPTKQSQAA